MHTAGNQSEQFESAHANDIGGVVDALETDRSRGLTAEQVAERVERFGHNELAQAPEVPAWKKFLAQFKELVIWILIAAAVIAGVAGEWVDTAAILAIVLLNGIIGFVQEEKAGRALEALKNMSAPTARVIRDGQIRSVPARELVPGDRIELEAGDNVPADARLIESYGLRVQEAALTGESMPVDKDPGPVLEPDAALGDRINMVYMGTVTAAGKASAVVVATGMRTQLGGIAGLLERHKPEPTPLQRRLGELGRILVAVCLVVVSIIFALELARGGKLAEVFLISVSLAVAAVPEGLPAVVTMALALGLQRMVKRNALIRKLPSVETLGSVTVICSDKTGTLTRNEMTVRELYTPGGSYQVTGAGYKPVGEFLECKEGQTTRREHASGGGDSSPCEPVDPEQRPDLIQTLTIAARCNHASVQQRSDSEDEWQLIGDPTEGALIVAARKAGITADEQSHPLIDEMPFDSERKAMSVTVREPGGAAVMYTKGAPEVILSKCVAEHGASGPSELSDARRERITRVGSEMASRALRVLAMAYRAAPDDGIPEKAERDMVFAGLVGMIDPPREEAKAAVRTCRAAGIRPVMITGDHPDTARAIARELEMFDGTSEPGGRDARDDQVVSGRQLDGMSDDELAGRVDRVSVYARVSPEHKLRVVRAWKSKGQVVAMTGDGVNDAPAVKTADIGIAMGITGTDVTKEASDMVLTDDNFASIVSAVEEGRGIFDNIQKFVHYLLSCNAGEVLLMFLAALVGWPVPLMAIQLLWVNLVTDGLPALALGMEPPEPDIMERAPRPPREPVITWRRGSLIVWHGVLVAAVAAAGYWWFYRGDEENVGRARTVAFCIIAYSQLLFAIACRSDRFTMPQLGLFSNRFLIAAIVVSGLLQFSVVTIPFLQPIFEVTVSIGWEWLWVMGLSLVPVTVIELVKLWTAGERGAATGE